MNKKREVKTIELNFSNKTLYIFLVLIVLVILGIGVYAYGNPGAPATLGHTTGELMPSCTGILTSTSGVANSWGCIPSPPSCSLTNQVLHWDGSSWSCATIDVGFDCYWSGWSPDCSCLTLENPVTPCGYDLVGNPIYATQTTQEYCIGGTITDTRIVWCCNGVGGPCQAM